MLILDSECSLLILFDILSYHDLFKSLGGFQSLMFSKHVLSSIASLTSYVQFNMFYDRSFPICGSAIRSSDLLIEENWLPASLVAHDSAPQCFTSITKYLMGSALPADPKNKI